MDLLFMIQIYHIFHIGCKTPYLSEYLASLQRCATPLFYCFWIYDV